MRIVRRVFLTLLVVVLVSVATFTVLRKFFGLRVEAWGAGYKPHFYFFKPEEHYSVLEKNRAEQKSASPLLPRFLILLRLPLLRLFREYLQPVILHQPKRRPLEQPRLMQARRLTGRISGDQIAMESTMKLPS